MLPRVRWLPLQRKQLWKLVLVWASLSRMLEGLRLRSTGVSVKAMLRLTIKRKRRNGALQAWSDNAPKALRATPTREFLVFRPDHVTCHRHS
jgi:hypothetical protein